MGLNHRPADYESAALPLSYAGSHWKETNRERQSALEHKLEGFLCGRLYLSSLGNVNNKRF